MDTKEIKNLLKGSTAVLVMDNNEPSFVVMDYDTYKDLTLKDSQKEIKVKNIPPQREAASSNEASLAPKERGEIEILERINKEILALKDEIEKEEKTLYPPTNID